MDKNVLHKGTLLGLVFLLLFFAGVVLAYFLITLSDLTDWNQAQRVFVALFVGPVLSIIGIVLYWVVKKPTLGA